jgi:DNA-binding response OmpR family regulator
VRDGAEIAAGLLRAVAAPPRDPVRIQALGGFRVVRAGEPVPVQEWQSRKARELLKVLVARRGHAVPREALMEALWPDEDPARLSNRLSVALSTVRTVLDPVRRYAPDRQSIKRYEVKRLMNWRVVVSRLRPSRGRW